jgi:sugar O-acyltransferase (sialic acid O-acetyltransferase NeuD family)
MINKRTLLILGAGGHGKSVAEAALLSNQWASIVFADDSWPEQTEIAGFPIIAKIAGICNLKAEISAAIPAVGDNQLRKDWFVMLKDLNIPLATILHPTAIVSRSATIGDGVTIMAGSVVGVDVKVGDGVIINLLCAIDHDAEIGNFSHLRVGVLVAGGGNVKPLTLLAAGSIIV